jgi:flagellar assembly protein FliH
VRISEEKFRIGPTDQESEIRYVPESKYNHLLERSQQEKEEAYRNGYSDGLQMGLAKGREESTKICAQFRQLMDDIRSQREDIFRQAELEIVELAYAIARKVISVHAEKKPEILLDSARRAAKLLKDRSNLVLRVASEQESFIKENLEELYRIDDAIRRISIETDRRVKPGGCILETESGNVDARIETELRNIEDSLRKANMSSPED